MLRTLLTTSLLSGLVLTGCGPREGQARARAEVKPPRAAETRDQAAAKPELVTTSADTATSPPPPVHPTVAAMAEAHIEGLMADYHALSGQVENVRTAVTAYGRRGRVWTPDLSGSQPWNDLIRTRLLWEEPANPFSPPEVAAQVHVIEEPGVAGESVSPRTAGWVWNSTDEVLEVARDSAAIRACGREAKRRTIREQVGPYLDPRLELIRAQITLYQLYESDDLWRPGEVASEQWTPLIRGGYVTRTPQNPMSPDDLSSRIVEVTEGGALGSAIDPATAGWVWNSTDHKLFAAGYDQ
ncbi:MAG: hypothetical protein ACYSU7_10550 [Planctomycetota bacterium]|jgi:hypothetical protein